MSRLSRQQWPILCYVTDRSAFPGAIDASAALLAKIREVAASGVDWIQIREKDLSARQLAEFTESVLPKISASASVASRPAILVNDRLDVALAQKAGGVHLGEKSISAEDARTLADKLHTQSEPPFLIGASCHSSDAARRAALSGADYVFFGPVFATPSKATYGAPQELDLLADVCQAVPIPVLAIGGVTEQNAASCLNAGAAGIAAIRLFQDAYDLPGLVPRLHALPLR